METEKRESAIGLLTEKARQLSSLGVLRYPARSDFTDDEVAIIKSVFGPWPRALEAAGLKPPRDGESKTVERRRRTKIAKRSQ